MNAICEINKRKTTSYSQKHSTKYRRHEAAVMFSVVFHQELLHPISACSTERVHLTCKTPTMLKYAEINRHNSHLWNTTCSLAITQQMGLLSSEWV